MEIGSSRRCQLRAIPTSLLTEASSLISDLVFKDNIVKQVAKRILPTAAVRKARDLLVDANTYKPKLAPVDEGGKLTAYSSARTSSGLERLIDRDLGHRMAA